jgi:hypothetical protein
MQFSTSLCSDLLLKTEQLSFVQNAQLAPRNYEYVKYKQSHN